MGRKTKYRDEYAHQVRVACEEFGATNDQLALMLNCSTSTLRAWAKEHTEFASAMKEGKEAFDAGTVERSILAMANGFYMPVQKLNPFTGQFEWVQEYHRPDLRAATLYMHNRRGWTIPTSAGPTTIRKALPEGPAEEDGGAEPYNDGQWSRLGAELMEARYKTRINVESEVIENDGKE